MTTLELMTPENSRWNQFADALFATTSVPGKPDHWLCDGDGHGESKPELVHRYAKLVMTEMGNIDIEGSLAFFRDHGGYCDCEMLFNVDPAEPPHKRIEA